MSTTESRIRVDAEEFSPLQQRSSNASTGETVFYSPMYPRVREEPLASGMEDGVRTGATGLIRQLPVDKQAFQTTYLAIETVRDPFNHQPYRRALNKTARFRLNLAAVLGQTAILSLLPMIAVLVADRMQHPCVYRSHEMENMQVYDYTDGDKPLVYVHTKNKDITRFPRPDKARADAVCALLVDASLQQRETLIRDYMGPFVTRQFSTDAKRQCGYFNEPDDIGDGGKNKWSQVYTDLVTRGFHYGAVPALTINNMKKQYVYVCVMEPIGLTIFGTEYFVEYLSLVGIFMFILAYLFGPGTHHDKCFTIAIIGTVMVSGMGVAMVSVLLTALYIYSLKWLVRKIYSREILAAINENRVA